MKKLLFTLIHYTWCLPQTLIAWIVRLFVQVDYVETIDHTTVYYTRIKRSSASLGHKIFLCQRDWHNSRILRHEYGHYKQSLILGWFYILIIAIPSLIWNVIIQPITKKDYYSFYTEKWAEKLGGNR